MRVIADVSPASRLLFLRALLIVFSGQVFLLSIALAEAPPAGHSFLTSTFWSASAYSEHAGGAACWLIGDDGSLRVEVLRDLMRLQTRKELSFGEHRLLESARSLIVQELAAVQASEAKEIEREIKAIVN